MCISGFRKEARTDPVCVRDRGSGVWLRVESDVGVARKEGEECRRGDVLVPGPVRAAVMGQADREGKGVRQGCAGRWREVFGFSPMLDDLGDDLPLEWAGPRCCGDRKAEAAEFLEFRFGYVPPVGGGSVASARGGRWRRREALLQEAG